MPLSTNSVRPKDDHRFDKFMREVRDEQGGARAIISNIPRQVITTKSMQPARPLVAPRDFPLVHKLEQKRPKKTVFKTGEDRHSMPTFAEVMETKPIVTSAAKPVVAAPKKVKRPAAKRTVRKKA